MKGFRAPARALLASLAVALPLAVPALPAAASTPGHAYRAELALNCNNPSFVGCQLFGLGGERGEFRFNADGTGSAQLTMGGRSGAVHASLDITGWTTGPASPYAGLVPGDDFFVQGTMRLSGSGVAAPVTVPIGYPFTGVMVDGVYIGAGDTGIPAAPGHYNLTELYGIPLPPGVSLHIEVTQVS